LYSAEEDEYGHEGSDVTIEAIYVSILLQCNSVAYSECRRAAAIGMKRNYPQECERDQVRSKCWELLTSLSSDAASSFLNPKTRHKTTKM
jgi:hypothetical protein